MKSFNKKGESLIEVIISLFILVMAGLAITTLMTSSMLASRMSRDKLIASNLAREGAEGVINMVSTNWLRFPGSQAECWNVLDAGIATSGQCSGKEISAGSFYILTALAPDSIIFNNNNSYFKWTLVPVSIPSPNNNGLNLTSENIGVMLPYCLFRESIPREGLLVQKGALGQEADCSGFYRQITVSYPDPSGMTKVMDVISKVQWLHKGEPQTVEIKTTLHNQIY